MNTESAVATAIPPTSRPDGSPNLVALLSDVAAWLRSPECSAADESAVLAGGAALRLGRLTVVRVEFVYAKTSWSEITRLGAQSAPCAPTIAQCGRAPQIAAYRSLREQRGAIEHTRRELAFAADALAGALIDCAAPPELVEASDTLHDWVNATPWRTLRAWLAVMAPQHIEVQEAA